MIDIAKILERFYHSQHLLRVKPLFIDMGVRGGVAYRMIEVIKMKKAKVEVSLQ